LYAQWQDLTFAVSVAANPAVGVTTKTGAGSYLYNANATVTWTLTAGYEVTSVTDNGDVVFAVTLPPTQLCAHRNSGQTTRIVINTRLTIYSLTYDGRGGTYNSSDTYSNNKTIGESFTVTQTSLRRAVSTSLAGVRPPAQRYRTPAMRPAPI
jgi:hypothetical protein